MFVCLSVCLSRAPQLDEAERTITKLQVANESNRKTLDKSHQAIATIQADIEKVRAVVDSPLLCRCFSPLAKCINSFLCVSGCLSLCLCA